MFLFFLPSPQVGSLMNIKIEFIGFPTIYERFPAGSHSYNFPGNSLIHLITDLIARHDSRLKESLLDPVTGSLDPAIQIIINQNMVSREQIQIWEIEEDAQITFLKLLAGG